MKIVRERERQTNNAENASLGARIEVRTKKHILETADGSSNTVPCLHYSGKEPVTAGWLLTEWTTAINEGVSSAQLCPRGLEQPISCRQE